MKHKKYTITDKLGFRHTYYASCPAHAFYHYVVDRLDSGLNTLYKTIEDEAGNKYKIKTETFEV